MDLQRGFSGGSTHPLPGFRQAVQHAGCLHRHHTAGAADRTSGRGVPLAALCGSDDTANGVWAVQTALYDRKVKGRDEGRILRANVILTKYALYM